MFVFVPCTRMKFALVGDKLIVEVQPKPVFTLVLVLLALTATAATIYKWIDESGVTH